MDRKKISLNNWVQQKVIFMKKESSPILVDIKKNFVRNKTSDRIR